MDEHGQLSSSDRKELPDSAYAFPDKRKEPLTDAKHVRMPWRGSTRSRT